MIVVDASVAVKWFLLEKDREQAMRVFGHPDRLLAPDFVILEVGNVLRRKKRLGMVTERQLADACTAVTRCFSRLIPATHLIEEAVRIALELDHAVYDCAYLACARIFDARLVTADDRFLDKVKRNSSLSSYATSLAAF